MKSNVASFELEQWRETARAAIAVTAAHHPEIQDTVSAYRELREILEEELQRHITSRRGES